MIRFLVVAVGLMTLSAGASAQLFSPGPLHKKHAQLEGLSQCLSCHEAGNRLSNAKCLSCHKEIQTRVSKSAGFHGRNKNRNCFECHREHKGKNSRLIKWEPSKSRFQHSLTGFKLEGKHQTSKCTDCHQNKRIRNAAIKNLMKKKSKTETFLGLPTRCKDCHFDEHRGQLSADCKKCHTPKTFTTTSFKHNRDSKFKLRGRHRRVKCAKCHSSQKDTATGSVFPAPVKNTFASYKPLEFKRCIDCHKDPHRGKRGRRCESCHSTKSWSALNENAMAARFHKSTRFPLQGEHADVKCAACHGPNKTQRKAKFKGIPFGRCDDCHHDAHVGQFVGFAFSREGVTQNEKLPTRKVKRTSPDCKMCHSEAGFSPSSFELEEHQRTDFALVSSHRAVGCRACHTNDKKLRKRAKRSAMKRLKNQNRLSHFSPLLFDLKAKSQECEKCHDDVHEKVFAAPVDGAKSCATCHSVVAFNDMSAFDHNRDSAFELKGAHATTPCSFCHVARENKPVPLFRGIASRCNDCHVDVHGSQFLTDKKGTSCGKCHDEKTFKPASKFDHQDEAFTSFKLRGKHVELKCTQCHAALSQSEGKDTVWYRGIPKTCAGCHADQHQGAFDAFVPESK